jgi:hypothetical protein
MPYVLSFEVNTRYEMRVDSVSEAIACYDKTYRMIGGWLEKYGASAELRCMDTGRVLQLYRGIRVMEAAREIGEWVEWVARDESWIRWWMKSNRDN